MKQSSRFTLALLVLPLIAGCGKQAETAEPAGPTVTPDTVTYPADSAQLAGIGTAKVNAPRDRELSIPGRLTWDEDHTVRVYTPFTGRVVKLVANVGDKVTAGQVLAEMTSADFGQAQADARKSEADVSVKRAQLARIRELAAAGISAAKDLQQAEADFATADTESKRATARLSVYGNNSGSVDQRYALRSPIAGTVVEKNINPGQELRTDQPGAPQFVVTNPARLTALLDANEADLQQLKIGTPLFISSPQYPDDTFAGELKQIADFIDPVSRTLKLRGAVPNTDRRLKAEMFVSGRIKIAKGEFPTIPEKAVFLDGVRTYVFVKTAPTTFRRKGIRVGSVIDGAMPVLSGLSEGEDVVIAGSLFLQQMLVSAGMKSEAVGSAKEKALSSSAAEKSAKP